jgi:hypothetical protein
MKDPATCAETEAILCNVGQVPQKIFNEPHSERIKDFDKASALAHPVSISLCTKKVISTSITLTQRRSR